MQPIDIPQLASLYRSHIALLKAEFERIFAVAGYDGVVIHSGVAKKRCDVDDQYWPLRVLPHFAEWLPLIQADCALVIEAGGSPKLLRPTTIDFWEAPPIVEYDYFFEQFNVVGIKSRSAMKSEVSAGKRYAFLGEDRSLAAELGLTAINPAEITKPLERYRTRKSPYEITCLDEANRRAAVGHEALAKAFYQADLSELDLHLAFLAGTRQDDPETPYKNIVALGRNCATLHHISYRKTPSLSANGAMTLLVDAGATFQGYGSDITRTWVKGAGAAASSFGAIVSGVEKLQQLLCKRAQVGLAYEELHNESHHHVAAVLREAGIARLSVDEIVSSGVSRTFFPHGLGHSLGLQVHDVGCAEIAPNSNNPFLRNTSVIAVDQVFTIEPGVYFIEPLLSELRASKIASAIDWKCVEALSPMGGVRIEDDIVMRKGGAENLTRAHLANSAA